MCETFCELPLKFVFRWAAVRESDINDRGKKGSPARHIGADKGNDTKLIDEVGKKKKKKALSTLPGQENSTCADNQKNREEEKKSFFLACQPMKLAQIEKMRRNLDKGGRSRADNIKMARDVRWHSSSATSYHRPEVEERLKKLAGYRQGYAKISCWPLAPRVAFLGDLAGHWGYASFGWESKTKRALLEEAFVTGGLGMISTGGPAMKDDGKALY
ncbi:hypothetical protein KM043_018723 [Ampulex compressa]|nr:hypothetical protein KM043_018723 [Ampulex compressa]